MNCPAKLTIIPVGMFRLNIWNWYDKQTRSPNSCRTPVPYTCNVPQVKATDFPKQLCFSNRFSVMSLNSMPFIHPVPWWTSSRLGLAVLGFLGFINVYALRVNMSVAIVCMVNTTALRLGDNSTKKTDYSECGLIPADANSTKQDGFEVGFAIMIIDSLYEFLNF